MHWQCVHAYFPHVESAQDSDKIRVLYMQHLVSRFLEQLGANANGESCSRRLRCLLDRTCFTRTVAGDAALSGVRCLLPDIGDCVLHIRVLSFTADLVETRLFSCRHVHASPACVPDGNGGKSTSRPMSSLFALAATTL